MITFRGLVEDVHMQPFEAPFQPSEPLKPLLSVIVQIQGANKLWFLRCNVDRAASANIITFIYYVG